jgi:predicted Zn-dependent protease
MSHPTHRDDRTRDYPPDPTSEQPRFLSEEECRALIDHILDLTNRRGETEVHIDTTWDSSVRWAHNRASTSSETRDITLELQREMGKATLNQTDPVSLEAAVHWAERMARLEGDYSTLPHFTYAPPNLTYPQTHIWSEDTYAMTGDHRGEIANSLMTNADQAGMSSAGYLNIGAGAAHVYLADGRMVYARYTTVECSLTVRSPDGRGSGWAGASSYDWTRINAQKLADVALDKCLRSRNPVRIEPGRYTLIMEPQATYDMIRQIMGGYNTRTQSVQRTSYMNREWEEDQLPFSVQRPFHDGHRKYVVSQWAATTDIGITKIGQQLLDPRITITFEPEDPDLGGLPFTYKGDPYVPVTWWDRGVLKTLAYERGHGPNEADRLGGQPNGAIFRMSGGDTSVDEMIATTKRGLIVTRFWGIKLLDPYSILCTGMTRDGLWLIENGKISHPVSNLRFTESPLFVFNQVDQLGVPVPVFAPGAPAIVPPVKVQDFSFTSLVDAI